MYDLIVLGGGPAGLTAAVYAVRKRLDMLIISPDLGGKTGWHLRLPAGLDRLQVISGEEEVARFKSLIENQDIAHKMERAKRVEPIEGGYAVATAEGHRYEAHAVIVATGATPQRLNIPGESKYRLRGLSYSAVSYAPLFLDKDVAVVGDTELAQRSALELARIAKKVFMVAPEPAHLDTVMGRRLRTEPNVTMLEGCTIREVKGDDAYARSIVVCMGGEEREIPVDVTFVELDLIPASGCVDKLVVLNEKKQIVTDVRNRTSRPGVFAAGDVTDVHAEQVLICIGEGAKAALSAYEYLLTL